MISVITEFGSSFKGLSAYLLHDVDRADTSERVAWTHTHGLATDDPEKAARIMAATAMSQAELKAEAGIKNTGRKSTKHVMHYVLSWSPTEHGAYSKDEMIDAAIASMTYIGTREGEKTGKKVVAKRTQYADEHQAVIVCHDEGPGSNPHIHIMLNRVHPVHGVMVSDSKDYEKLSAWALDYRQSQGLEHLCPERVKNAAKRAQGVLSSHPRKPRNVYEQEQAIEGADPGSRKKALLELQARRGKELKAKTEQMKRDQAKAVRVLEDGHIAGERAERARSAEMIRAKKAEIKSAYAPRIDELTQRHADEKETFNEAKRTAAGRVRNTWAAFKTKEWMTQIRTRPLHAMKQGFALAFDSGLQELEIQKHHTRERGDLNGSLRREERDAARSVREDEGERVGDLRQGFAVRRNDLVLGHDMNKAKLKAEWHQLTQDRRAAAAEDERARKTSPTSPTSNAGSPGGSGQQDKRDLDQEGVGGIGLVDQMRSVDGGLDDVPIDEIRAALRDIKQQSQSLEDAKRAAEEYKLQQRKRPRRRERDNDHGRD